MCLRQVVWKADFLLCCVCQKHMEGVFSSTCWRLRVMNVSVCVCVRYLSAVHEAVCRNKQCVLSLCSCFLLYFLHARVHSVHTVCVCVCFGCPSCAETEALAPPAHPIHFYYLTIFKSYKLVFVLHKVWNLK